MAVKILHKRSAVEFKSATGAQLEFGELGLNYHESGPYLQCKDAAGEVVQLGGVYIGTSAPGNELKGAWWLRESDNTLFLYNGTSWVSIAGGSGGSGGTTIVVGADGIEATTVGDTVTVEVDLASDSHGLSIVAGKLQADIATETTLGTVKIGDGIDVGADGEISVDLSGVDVNADLEYVPNGNNAATITNTAGDDATVPIATDSVAGLFTGDEKQKLAGIEDGAAANQDLGYTADGNNAGTVTITDGTDATVPIVTDTVAGLMTGTQKQKLDGIEDGAQVNDGYSQAESDGRYLRIDAGAPDQTRVSGEATFAELTTHASGVEVTGGTYSGNPGIFSAGNGNLQIHSANRSLGIYRENTKLIDIANIGSSSTSAVNVAYSSYFDLPNADSQIIGFNVDGDNTNLSALKDAVGYNFFFPRSDRNAANDPSEEIVGFKASPKTLENELDNPAITYYGFKSELNSTQNFNFFSAGNAPNFHAGSTYIGGNTSRNTFELWQSTLTEEQLEQFEAGTLAAPANVSLPGDGEFARQWWHNQQSAEDQALIDSGELEYPEHLAAATFTDTFALGENTQINLESATGTGRFKGNLYVKNKLCVNVGPDVATSRLHVRHGSQSVLRGVNTNDFGSSNLDLVGGRNSTNVGAGSTSDLGSLNFYNHQGNSSTTDKENNAKRAAAIHVYSQSNNVANSAAGVLAFAVTPSGIDPNTGEVYKPKDFLSINQNGSVLVSDWYDTTKFALVVNTQTDTDAVILKTNTKETISFESAIGLGQTAGDKRNVAEFKVPNNSNGQATQSIFIGSKRLFDGNTAAQAHSFIQGKTGKLVFDHGSSGTTRFFGIDSSSGTEVENLAYTISKDGSMKIENMTTFNLQMESDDPAAFQTTYSTDEEGNQVENQTYIGTTEDLLSIIRDLRSRVDALEAQLNP